MKEKNNFISRLNAKIGQLSKLSLVLILLVYTLLLTGVVALTSINKKYLVIPEYEHVYFDEKINPAITVIGKRTFDDDDKMSLTYSINVNIHGRITEESTADPGYSLTSFKMSAATVENLYTTKVKNMYYFTEYNTYTSPTTHYYTLDNSSVDQHPSTIYTMIQYKKYGETYISTFKEDIMLQPTEADKLLMSEFYNNNEGTEYSSSDMYDKDDYMFANIQFMNNQTSSEDVYKVGVKITMSSLSWQSKHHVDMQSWILTEDGKYLPFIGVYSYSQQKSNYVSSTYDVNKKLNPVYICSKFVYYFGENDYKTYYFMQDITKLSDTFATDPTSGVGGDEEANNPLWLIIAISCLGVIVVASGTVLTIYIVKKKKDKKNKATEVESTTETNKLE